MKCALAITRAIALLFFVIISKTTIAQSNYDVRKVKWGMTEDEVISSESPLTPIINKTSISFEGIEIGNSLTATIIYEFTNKRLSNVHYVIYGYAETKGTCNNIIDFKQKVYYTKFILDMLHTKGYICDTGWFDYSDQDCQQYKELIKNYDCSIDEPVLNNIENAAKTCNVVWVRIRLENKRSTVSITYNEWQNDIAKTKSYYSPKSCEDTFYNTLCWISFNPSSEVTKDLEKDNF